MTTNFVTTENIFVFPSTRRMNKQVSARLISEASLANIINKLIDVEGFVITPEPESGDYVDIGYIPSDPFEFNLFGYYFKVNAATDITNLFNSSTNIYANIYLDKTNADSNYIELKSSDSNLIDTLDDVSNNVSYFKGVTFSDVNLSESDSNKADHSLLLFTRQSIDNSNWTVPIESRFKFFYTLALGVDGGEILKGDKSI